MKKILSILLLLSVGLQAEGSIVSGNHVIEPYVPALAVPSHQGNIMPYNPEHHHDSRGPVTVREVGNVIAGEISKAIKEHEDSYQKAIDEVNKHYQAVVRQQELNYQAEISRLQEQYQSSVQAVLRKIF